MILTTTPIKQHTQLVHLDMPYTYEEVLNELHTCEFNEIHTHRYNSEMTATKILSEIKQLIVDYSFIDKFYEIKDFQLLWNNVSKEELKKKCKFNCSLHLDKPKFSLTPHLDSRQIVIVGMIFFNPVNDIKQNTVLYDTENMLNPQYVPSSFGEGWVMANAHNTWHSGGNSSDQDRYSILFSYTI